MIKGTTMTSQASMSMGSVVWNKIRSQRLGVAAFLLLFMLVIVRMDLNFGFLDGGNWDEAAVVATIKSTFTSTSRRRRRKDDLDDTEEHERWHTPVFDRLKEELGQDEGFLGKDELENDPLLADDEDFQSEKQGTEEPSVVEALFSVFKMPQGEAANRTLPLPRSSTRPYNELHDNEKYLAYTPSGGFNNQLICFLSGIYLAKKYNRTLIVPPNGRHRNFYTNYLALTLDEVVPMDTSIDFAFMEKMLGVRLLPLDKTLESFHHDLFGEGYQNAEGIEMIRLSDTGLTKGTRFYHQQVFDRGLKSRKHMLWIHGKFYTHRFEKAPVRKLVRYSPFFVEFAQMIEKKMLGGTFNAMHIRLGDKYKKEIAAKAKDARVYLKKARRLGFDQDTPLYIATDGGKKNRYFAPLTKYFKTVYFQEDLASIPALRPYLERYYMGTRGSEELRSDVFGLIEQLVCVRANKFVGSLMSTFSKTISKQRLNLFNAIPDAMEKLMDEKSKGLIRASMMVDYFGKWGGSTYNETRALFDHKDDPLEDF